MLKLPNLGLMFKEVNEKRFVKEVYSKDRNISYLNLIKRINHKEK
jgi:hypothetical protein